MLARVPRHPALPGVRGLWFADHASQKRTYGFEWVDSYAALQTLSDRDHLRFAYTVVWGPHGAIAPPEDTRFLRDVTGYDYMQVDREAYTINRPDVWSRLEGHFDHAAIMQVLAQQDYTTVSYQGRTILTRGADYETSEDYAITRFMFALMNRVALDEQGLTATPSTELIQASIDAQAGHMAAFDTEPDYAAMATALGPVVGAAFFPGDAPYLNTVPGVAATSWGRLHPHPLASLALRDDGTTHTMLIALCYGQAADAEADAPVLRQRLIDYRLRGTGELLSNRAVPADPVLVPAGERTVLLQPLAIADEVNLWLWVQMFFQGDLRFLAE